MKELTRVLQVVSTPNIGGVETMLMNIYRNIDKSKVQFDFTSHGEDKGKYSSEIEASGGIVHLVKPIKKIGVVKYTYQMYKLIKNNKYDIVHSHINTNNALIMLAAKLAGAKVRISHAHSTSSNKNKLQNVFLKILIRIFSTKLCACGIKASEYMYGKKLTVKNKVKIINNAIDLKQYFEYSNTSKEARKKYSISEETLVVGHIGRFFGDVKNHDFILKIATELKKITKNFKIVLVGEGPTLELYKKLAIEKGIAENIMFFGTTNNIPEVMQLFDIFILPSLYEGFPLVLVEAQASLKRCIVSNTVTNEVDLGLGLVSFEDLNIGAKVWANTIYKKAIEPKDNLINYDNMYKTLTERGFNIEKSAEEMLKLYNIN